MLDLLLFAAFAIGFPTLSGPVYLRRRDALLTGDYQVRRREYQETILWLSAMGAATVALWLAQGRALSELGLGLTWNWRVAVAVGMALGVSALLRAQLRATLGDAATRAAVRETLEPVREYFPRTAEETRLFRILSFAAGIGEEIYYRGFLIWYLAGVTSLWWSLLLSSILFGLAHWMHGVQATLRSTITGAVFAGVYLLSGSLWASMILHTAIDLTNGAIGAAAFSED